MRAWGQEGSLKLQGGFLKRKTYAERVAKIQLKVSLSLC